MPTRVHHAQAFISNTIISTFRVYAVYQVYAIPSELCNCHRFPARAVIRYIHNILCTHMQYNAFSLLQYSQHTTYTKYSIYHKHYTINKSKSNITYPKQELMHEKTEDPKFFFGPPFGTQRALCGTV